MGIDHASKRKKGDSGRDGGGFVALPWSVLDSLAFRSLSHPARSLLWELGRQLGKDNNGRLLLSSAYLAKRGWNSDGVIDRAKKDLLAKGLVFQTVQGHRPNKASWFAVTWYALSPNPAYDPGVKAAFIRGEYRNFKPEKIEPLTPSEGVGERCIALSEGVEDVPSTLGERAIKATFDSASTLSQRFLLASPCAGELKSADQGNADCDHEPAEAS
ncbi:hypothetical protein [Rugamonas apoptosis]|uniref:Helix-turn-helix domain-containing protein n=1 Tax=Rugamonas apoptosis TaxID=2758570 RepID=A0A7W2IJX1_9BURK|nr:hypothetical protein [Rugamonas apoptosis]MBA5686973.1 hypothetical protein [Rugamonas apoptosis]